MDNLIQLVKDVLCPYCGVNPVDAAGRSCTECDDMLCNCDPGDEDGR